MAGSGKGKLDHYECDGQLSMFDFIKPVCNYSGHACNKAELPWLGITKITYIIQIQISHWQLLRLQQ